VKIPSEAELIEMEQRFDYCRPFDDSHAADFDALVAVAREFRKEREKTITLVAAGLDLLGVSRAR
jgi:hypothetical protein